MPDYNSSEITVRPWQRADRIVIENPIPGTGTPAVTFVESMVYPTPSGKYAVESLGNLVEPLVADGEGSNINEVFDLLNPLTGEPLGVQSSYAQAQVMLYSLYLHVARKRDSRVQTPPPPE